MRRLTAAALSLACLAATGCFDIEQSLTLERNLSGRAGFAMKMDMEPFAVFGAMMQRAMTGKTGDPTPEEIEAAKKEMLAEKKANPPEDFIKERKDFESKLPQGVTLIDANAKEDGLKMAMNMVFGFDHASKLSQIKFPEDAGPAGMLAPGGGGGDSAMESPFGGLTVTDEGATVLVTSPPVNPAGDAIGPDAKMPPDPTMKKGIEDILKGLRVAFKITSPMTVVEHNAHRREGNTLVWEYNMESLEKLTEAQLKQSIKVRYRK
jgi:hypothetical protein